MDEKKLLELIRKAIKEEVGDRLDSIEERLYRVEREIKRLNWRIEDLEEEMDSLRRRMARRGVREEVMPVIEPTPALGGIMGCEWDDSGESLD